MITGKGSRITILLMSYLFGFLTCHQLLVKPVPPPCVATSDHNTVVVNNDVGQLSKDATSATETETETARGMILPFERSEKTEYIPGEFTDAYTYFHHYLHHFSETISQPLTDFKTLPLLHIWPHYFEAYHNHWQRYRGKEVTFMEIGVQSGGKIPLLRNYFGPGFKYIGIDINPSTDMFDGADWVNIEIGDSADPAFWKEIRAKYPKVDLFLDDGGHKMRQQRTAMEEMLPHVQADGVYICEDLSTSWGRGFNGYPNKDSRDKTFMDNTMVGLVHRSLDWLNAAWIPGQVMKDNSNSPKLDNFWPKEPWWREFQSSVKHIHYYNQLVVYEKGLVEHKFPTFSVGHSIPYAPSGTHEKVEWSSVLERIKIELSKGSM